MTVVSILTRSVLAWVVVLILFYPVSAKTMQAAAHRGTAPSAGAAPGRGRWPSMATLALLAALCWAAVILWARSSLMMDAMPGQATFAGAA